MVINKDGEAKVIAQILDITEEKRSRQALAESEERFRKTFEAITDPSFIWEQRPDGQIVLKTVNRTLTELSKGAIDAHIDKDVEHVFAGCPEIVSALRTTMETGKSSRMEFPFALHPGPTRWLIWDLTRPSQDLVLMITTDITDRMVMERELRNAKEKAMLYLDLMAHDITDQLQALRAATDLLRREMPQDRSLLIVQT